MYIINFDKTRLFFEVTLIVQKITKTLHIFYIKLKSART